MFLEMGAKENGNEDLGTETDSRGRLRPRKKFVGRLPANPPDSSRSRKWFTSGKIQMVDSGEWIGQGWAT